MIRLESVSKRYPNGQVAVENLSLEVDAGEICVLVGPSGCGKTTTLKMINRLVEPTSGRIFLDGEDVTKGDPVALRRRLGYVIQQTGLFPHQTIAVNVGTVPRLLGWSRERIAARVDELLALVGLDPAAYRKRYPAQLSGGERQRVGVARALAADPPVLLMDEPFGAIDPVNRERLQDEFLRIQQGLGTTVVFVTHDVKEAVKMGDRIAVLQVGGRLLQYDKPAEILARPATSMVADFVGQDRGMTRLKVVPINPDDLPRVCIVRADDGSAAVRQTLEQHAMDWAVVVDDDGTLTGEVSLAKLTSERPVRDAMQPAGATVEATGSLADALSALLLTDEARVVVVTDGKPRGFLTAGAIYRAARTSIRANDPDRTIETK